MGFRERLREEIEYRGLLVKDVSSAELLAAYARERGCHYIVLNKDHYVDGELADYDYEPVYRTKQYLVYRNLQGDFFTP